MKWYRMLAAGLVLALLTGCAGGTLPAGQAAKALTPGGESVKVEPRALPEADRALGDFGGRLLTQVRNVGENTLISPLSILLCLAMCANGAEGDTLQEFLDALGGGAALEDLNASCASLIEDYLALEGSTQCNIAGGLWVDDRMSADEDFLRRCADIYRAGVYQGDLDTPKTVEQVNAWVKEQTHDMIDSILSDPPSSETVLLLVNALYLKNTWAREFDPIDTYSGNFYPKSGGTQTLDYLHNSEREELYFATGTERGVVLPYDDGRLGFLAVLPEDGDLTRWLGSWDGETLPELLAAAKETPLSLALPKFEAEWGGSLAKMLQSMGLKTAFDEERAEFSGMGEADGNIYLSDVVHKTRIEVNEKGTEAAAVTMAVMADCCALIDPPEQLTLDRPFVYGIVDLERQIPIFLGTFETAE